MHPEHVEEQPEQPQLVFFPVRVLYMDRMDNAITAPTIRITIIVSVMMISCRPFTGRVVKRVVSFFCSS